MPEFKTKPPIVQLLVRSMNRSTLPDLFEAIAAQTYPAVEVIVVNASGGSHLPLPSLGQSVRLIEPGRPLSRPEAANCALDQAGDGFAMFIDDDDLIEPAHVERLVAAVADEPQHPAAYAGVRLVGDGNRTIATLDEPWSRGILLIHNFMPIHSILFRMTAVWRGSCRFDEGLSCLEDWDFWLQLSQDGDFVHVPGVSASYRLHLGTSGLSANFNTEMFVEARDSVYRKWLQHFTPATLAGIANSLSATAERSKQAIEAVRAEAYSSQKHIADKLANLQCEMDEVMNSRSMRLTAPFKVTLRHVRQLREILRTVRPK